MQARRPPIMIDFFLLYVIYKSSGKLFMPGNEQFAKHFLRYCDMITVSARSFVYSLTRNNRQQS
jgi:hypothetical protein